MSGALTTKDVFIGTPTHICKRYCAAKFSTSLMENKGEAEVHVISNSLPPTAGVGLPDSSDYPLYYKGFNLTQLLLPLDFYNQRDSIHRRLVHTMNLLRSKFLNSSASIFLSLESDVVLEKYTLDDILRVLNENPDVDVLHTNCYQGFNIERRFTLTDRITLGCTAIRQKVLDNINFRYDPNLLAAFHDAFFSYDCKERGFRMYYAPHIKVRHLEKVNGGGRGWNELPRGELM